MSTLDFDALPQSMQGIRTRPLFVMRLEVKPVFPVGPAPEEYRRVGIIAGGAFSGERLSGKVLEGGSDWQTVRRDGTVIINVRLVLQASDDALVAMTYQGVRSGPADVIAALDRGEAVDPASYYFRINPLFQTAAPQYDWLNRVVGVGSGHRFPDGPVYSLFEIL